MSENHPDEPGYYWAKLVTPEREPDEEDWVSSTFEIVCVDENYGEGRDEFRAYVPGIGVGQSIEAFEWGPFICALGSETLGSRTSVYVPADIPSGITELAGKPYMFDPLGNAVPLENVGAADKLIDEQVRKVLGFHIAAAEQIARLKKHTFDDISELEALLAQEHETTIGGKKGNMTLTSFDGLYKVQVQVADRLAFGPELQIAKTLIDECLTEWSADARPELRAIVTRAFNTDKEGQINRSELFMLLRLEIDDTRWKNAMKAIRAAMRVIGSKVYVRCYQRPSADAQWQAVTTDMAKL